jgi:hypothetical protein
LGKAYDTLFGGFGKRFLGKSMEQYKFMGLGEDITITNYIVYFMMWI